jgi:hypothetical protein
VIAKGVAHRVGSYNGTGGEVLVDGVAREAGVGLWFLVAVRGVAVAVGADLAVQLAENLLERP